MAREYDHLFKLLIIGDSGEDRGPVAGTTAFCPQGVVTVYDIEPASVQSRVYGPVTGCRVCA